jgi:hypothetical protein
VPFFGLYLPSVPVLTYLFTGTSKSTDKLLLAEAFDYLTKVMGFNILEVLVESRAQKSFAFLLVSLFITFMLSATFRLRFRTFLSLLWVIMMIESIAVTF